MSSSDSDARSLQAQLAESVQLVPMIELPKFVVGVDAAYVESDSNPRPSNTVLGIGAAVVIDTSSFEVIEEATITVEVAADYQPGFLAAREAPVLLAAIDQLDHKPDLVVCDGHGIAHPRRAGLACHVGVALGIPTIGCAKQPLVGPHIEVGTDRGAFEPVVVNGETVGAVVRTSSNVKPVYVSPGHLIDVDSSVRHILALAPKFRLPETTRAADHLARKAAAEA